MKAPLLDIITAIRDPNIIGDTLSAAQEAALRVLYGLPLPKGQLSIARTCLGPAWKPTGEAYREAAFICGRRAGKSDKLAANAAIFEAFFRGHRLSVGETGVVLLLAQNMRQGQVVKGYIEGKIKRSPILRQHLVASRMHELELDNGITIAIHPASFRAVRGMTVVCCICDEIAFWWTEGYANPDIEVVRAVRPAMATCEFAKLLLISSPYARNGVLWDLWRRRDEDPDTLVWHAPTGLMNPAVTKQFLAKAKAQDPEFFRREYGAEFVDAVSAFLSADAIGRCVVRGRQELPAELGKHQYVCAIDAAFKGDRFTLCIGHHDHEQGKVVIDCLRGWQGSSEHPVQLGAVVIPQARELNREYSFEVVHADQFGAQPLKEAFERNELSFEEHVFTNASKADMYATLRTRIGEDTLELLDHEDSLRELRGLQLELLPGGATRIGHAGQGKAKDDYADAIALVVALVSQHGNYTGGVTVSGWLESWTLPT